jgi:hypothetical protein
MQTKVDMTSSHKRTSLLYKVLDTTFRVRPWVLNNLMMPIEAFEPLFVSSRASAQHNDTQHNNAQHNNTQHNDTQHNRTQYNGLICDTRHK